MVGLQRRRWLPTTRPKRRADEPQSQHAVFLLAWSGDAGDELAELTGCAVFRIEEATSLGEGYEVGPQFT